MKTKVIKVDAAKPDRRKIEIAAKVIKSGGVVVFPTETVYGIGADAYNANALRRVYRIKGRPLDNPSMIHVSSMRMASRLGFFPKRYRSVIGRIWPGPIAFVVNAKKGLNREEVSMRMPAHKVALALIEASGVPIAAPSANISKRPSSTTAKHALRYFDGKVDVILDAGSSNRGIESTILDLRTFRIQRPGSYPIEDITRAFGKRPIITRVARGLTEAKRAVAPGMKYKHYAPLTPLFLYTGKTGRLDRVARVRGNFAFIGSDESCRVFGNRKHIRLGKRNDLDSVAKNLFDALIRLDEIRVDYAIAESFPERGIGLGIMNRLRKAASHRYFSSAKGLEKLRKSINR